MKDVDEKNKSLALFLSKGFGEKPFASVTYSWDRGSLASVQ